MPKKRSRRKKPAHRKHISKKVSSKPKRKHGHAQRKHVAAKRHPKQSRHTTPEKPASTQKDFLLSLKQELAQAFSEASGLKAEAILPLIERPPEGIGADFAIPCFVLAKQLRKAPQQIAQEVAGRIAPLGRIKEARHAGPYVNFLVDWKAVGQELIPHILSNPGYGSSRLGKGKTIVMDFSHPNVAKPMSVGHLRSTVIGDSLCRIYRNLGYRVIGDNHMGDWGTQFGKIMVAYRKWGHPEKLGKSPIEELLRVYVKFHEETEIEPGLEDEARKAFKRLEDGDKESLALWKRFSDLSLKEFGKIYRILGVKFDTYLGESFYLKMSRDVIEEAVKKGVAKWSEGALIIDVGMEIPLVIQKSDEATLYATRDLATIKYRLKEYKPDEVLYVVGSEQKQYFEQVFIAAERLGYIKKEERGRLVHIPFGMVSLPEGKMSTRKGRVVFLDHVIGEVTKMAGKVIEAKNPALKDRETVARQVGIGAIKYADLSRDRIKDIRFDWSEMLSFEGDTGPYLQYTHARACSILRKGKIKAVPKKIDATLLIEPQERALVRKLCELPETIERAARDSKPHYAANYAFTLATLFNEFYQAVPVLRAEGGLRAARLALVMATKEVLKKGLYLLGIEAPEEM
ncbi:MAG TPA: arginine--tRNA ligase [archaeon]|nr:arginine--tRNA ligase [archaeon]